MRRKYYSMASMSNIGGLAAGLMILFTAGVINAATLIYTYDNLHRLTRIDHGNGTVTDYTYDAAGNRKRETVASDTQDPTVNIVYPSSGSTVNGNVTITANANDRVSKVEFYIDNALWFTDYLLPYDTSGRQWDTTQASNGTQHTIIAKAYDASGRSATSTVTVTVKTHPVAIMHPTFPQPFTSTNLIV